MIPACPFFTVSPRPDVAVWGGDQGRDSHDVVSVSAPFDQADGPRDFDFFWARCEKGHRFGYFRDELPSGSSLDD